MGILVPRCDIQLCNDHAFNRRCEDTNLHWCECVVGEYLPFIFPDLLKIWPARVGYPWRRYSCCDCARCRMYFVVDSDLCAQIPSGGYFRRIVRFQPYICPQGYSTHVTGDYQRIILVAWDNDLQCHLWAYGHRLDCDDQYRWFD